MLRGLFLLLALTSVLDCSTYKMSRDIILVGWDSFEEKKPLLWTNVEECEQAREQCYKIRDCKDDVYCLGELQFEPTTVEERLGLHEEKPDKAHDVHPCVQLAHYCYGIDRAVLKRVINQRVYWQFAYEHNLNHA